MDGKPGAVVGAIALGLLVTVGWAVSAASAAEPLTKIKAELATIEADIDKDPTLKKARDEVNDLAGLLAQLNQDLPQLESELAQAKQEHADAKPEMDKRNAALLRVSPGGAGAGIASAEEKAARKEEWSEWTSYMAGLKNTIDKLEPQVLKLRAGKPVAEKRIAELEAKHPLLKQLSAKKQEETTARLGVDRLVGAEMARWNAAAFVTLVKRNPRVSKSELENARDKAGDRHRDDAQKKAENGEPVGVTKQGLAEAGQGVEDITSASLRRFTNPQQIAGFKEKATRYNALRAAYAAELKKPSPSAQVLGSLLKEMQEIYWWSQSQ